MQKRKLKKSGLMAHLFNLQYIEASVDSTLHTPKPFFGFNFGLSFATSLIVISFRNIEFIHIGTSQITQLSYIVTVKYFNSRNTPLPSSGHLKLNLVY